MKVEFLKSFSKDLDSVNSKSAKQSLVRIIASLEKVEDLKDTRNLKSSKDLEMHIESE